MPERHNLSPSLSIHDAVQQIDIGILAGGGGGGKRELLTFFGENMPKCSQGEASRLLSRTLALSKSYIYSFFVYRGNRQYGYYF